MSDFLRTSGLLIVITGPTASGKTGLALSLAERYGGEIVCADSRTIYRGMDIGTAKPTPDQQRRVRHHLIDIVGPGERCSVVDFQQLAFKAINDIRRRGRVPFLVGGTGLYVDAVMLDYSFSPRQPGSTAERTQWEACSVEELQLMIKERHLLLPENKNNRRHLLGVLERGKANPSRRSVPDSHTAVVSIATDDTTLSQRIVMRTDDMFRRGVIDEAQRLALIYGWDSTAMTGNGYPILKRLLHDEIDEREAKTLFCLRDRQLVKKQRTWLRRHRWLQWRSLYDAEHYLDSTLRSSVVR